MGSIDLVALERRVRWAYELGRLRRALWGVAPVALVVAAATAFAHRPTSALWFGLVTLTASAVMLWYGRDPQRAVLPGVGAGLVPLLFALCANHIHVCGPDGCSTLCLPACALGGAIAGLSIAAVGHRRQAGAAFWASAAGLSLLTGAMGCACIGYSGLVGLVAGFGAGTLPGLLRRAFAGRIT